MACIVCVEWEETTGRRAGATRSAHRIGLTYRMGRPRSARRPGVISPVRWNGGIPHADLFDRRRHLPGSMERGDRFDPLSGDADVVSSVRGIGWARRCLQSSRGARSVLTSFGGYASAILAGRRLPDSPNRPRWGRKLPSAQRRLRGLRRLGLRGFGSQSS